MPFRKSSSSTLRVAQTSPRSTAEFTHAGKGIITSVILEFPLGCADRDDRLVSVVWHA